MRFPLHRCAVAFAIALTSVMSTTATAHATDALLPEHRTLFMTERFTPTTMRTPLAGWVQPHDIVTLRGEHEGFQFAVRNTTSAPLSVAARLTGDPTLESERAAGRIDLTALRVRMVDLPRGSTGMGTSGGRYADPLPPFGSGAAGRLTIDPGTWGGVAVLASVRTDARPGAYSGTLELTSGSGSTEVVHARQAFTLSVRSSTLLQAGAPGSFTTIMDVESESYWLQHEAMRNGPSRYPSWPDRMAQVTGLMSFLDSRGITPATMRFGAPSAAGNYTCAYDPPGNTGLYAFRSQLTQRYFDRARGIDPGTARFPTRVAPNRTTGCNPDRATDDFHATVDRQRTPGVKQDDVLHPRAGTFFTRVSSAWRANGWFGRRTYTFNPFDEPGDATAAQRATMRTQVPAANVKLHRAFGNRAKVVLTSWPRDSRSRKICRRYGSGTRCTTMSGDQYSNRAMWDGRGLDDVDVWVSPISRLYGRTTPAALRAYGAKARRDREYATRLAGIRRARAGRETWAYNFFTATRTMPQLTIDAPGTDPRLQYWLLARDGHTGLFVSNTMLGWGAAVQRLPNGLRRKGNPYDEATYFQHRQYGYAAGWGTFIYPGYDPGLGLVSEEARNSERSRPASSLRLEAMRDGQEDANLAAMYRSRFGDRALQAQMRLIFPGSVRALPRTLGNVVIPAWSNRNMAQRLETRRRAMINRIAPS